MAGARNFDLSKLKTFANEANVFMKQLMEESDRGAALVGLAYLDELLKRLCEAKMLGDNAVRKRLLKYPGPLSTASARTDVAYILGWIGPETYRDFVTLRGIRNKFAHAHAPVTFSDPAIEALGRELHVSKALSYRLKARDQFLVTASMLALRLEYYRRDSQPPAPGCDPPVTPVDPAELEGAIPVEPQ